MTDVDGLDIGDAVPVSGEASFSKIVFKFGVSAFVGLRTISTATLAVAASVLKTDVHRSLDFRVVQQPSHRCADHFG